MNNAVKNSMNNGESRAAELACKEAARLMSRQQDAALSPEEQEALKNHLFDCLGCRQVAAQLDFLRRFARQYADAGPPVADGST
ncbi:MAG: zf-HC2 domain-containing protein [Betaproteobacteria bacterium]|nr:zf-HC2 domain-containing protein [Betaproteobacteria bacterium]